MPDNYKRGQEKHKREEEASKHRADAETQKYLNSPLCRDFSDSAYDLIKNAISAAYIDLEHNWTTNGDEDYFDELFINGEIRENERNIQDYHDAINRQKQAAQSTLNSIWKNVQHTENYYSTKVLNWADNLRVVAEKLRDISSLADPQPNAVNIAAFNEHDLTTMIENLSTDQLAYVDVNKLTFEQRQIYFLELYRRLAKLWESDPKDLDANTLRGQGMFLSALTKMNHEDKMAFVFNEGIPGRYGGDQGSPYKKFKGFPDEYKKFLEDFVRAIEPKIDVNEFLDEYLNKHGCSYVAAINSILVEYADRPWEFERRFGFPLYTVDKKGRVLFNFDQLTVDFYCFAYYTPDDAKNPEFVQNAGEDGIMNTIDDTISYTYPDGKTITFTSGRDGIPGALGDGQVSAELSVNLTRYLESKGIENATISKEYEPLSGLEKAFNEEKTVVLFINPTVMHDNKDKLYPSGWTNAAGSHDIVVTGIKENGDLTVSSWGGEYTIPSKDFGNYTEIQFQTIDFSKGGNR